MKRLAIYLAISFGLTWGLLIPAGIALGTFEAGENSSALMFALIAVSMFFPLIGALVANFACKPEERIDLGIKPLIGKNINCYLVAWFLPAAIALIGDVVFFVANPYWFDPTMQSYLETVAAPAGLSIDELASQMPPAPLMLSAVLASALTIAPFINMIPAFGEELGWRGMLFPSLAEHMSERAAALTSGVIWGLWHAPAIAMGHNYGMGYSGFPLSGILVMTLMCAAMACWLSYLRKRSGSVWPCALAHGAFNAIANVGLVFCTVGQTLFGPTPLGLVAGIPLLAVGCVCFVKLSAAKTSHA
ncbi:MAG: CPBP family intramembrane metalloprotease [Eggerthellaceae bacterium]|nr:CPBP family intramembrane metalloprotease [Eggerthellaceae bacterium]